MSNANKFDPEDLDPNVLNEALQSLSDYYIPKRRLIIRASKKPLGVGGFGTVKLADLWPTIWIPFVTLPTTVAVKELRAENYYGAPLRTAVRLAREIKVWASCKHDNILEFTGYYLSGDFRTAYLVSPYMANGNIKDYLSRWETSQERRLELVLDTIKGLAYLHSKDPPIVHGDLKSLNVLVNEAHKALLSDFGLAQAMEDKPTGLSTSNGFKGTIRYTSPEVLNGSPRDCPSDIWAWGCLALEIITGNPPYHECQNETQVLVLICGHQDHRRTPEPSDISTLFSTVLDLLRMCWSFVPGRRPDARQCVDEVETIHWIQHTTPLSSSLPADLFTPPARLDLSIEPEDWNDLVFEVSIARLSLRDTDKVVMVRGFAMSSMFGKLQADELNERWALKHENLIELTGYSMDRSLQRLYVISPYMGQTLLLQYLRRNRHLVPGARLKLLQDVLNGLIYLHSSAVNVVHGALNPWTVVVDGDRKAVLPLIGSVINLGFGIEAGPLRRPAYLWQGPQQWDSDPLHPKSDIWSWACIVLQVMCEIRQFDGTSIHSPEFTEFTGFAMIGGDPKPVPTPILPDRLLSLLIKCWRRERDERPTASECSDVLDLLIQERSTNQAVYGGPVTSDHSTTLGGVTETHGSVSPSQALRVESLS